MAGRPEHLGDGARGRELVAVALAVVEGECVAVEASMARHGEDGGAVEAAGEEDDGGRARGHGRVYWGEFAAETRGHARRAAGRNQKG